MMRLAVLIENLGPYHVARLAGAARTMDVLSIEVLDKSGVYAWQRPDLPASLAHVQLGAVKGAGGTGWTELLRHYDEHIAPFRPDAIAVTGWSTLADIAATHWAVRRGLPVIVMSDSTPWDFRRSLVVNRLKGRLLRHYAAALVGGRSHRDYLVSLGMPPEAIFLGYDAVDNDYFAAGTSAARGKRVMPELEGGRRLPAAAHGRTFLASGRFIEKKNLRRLIEAYGQFRRGRADDPADWPLVILGDGRLRAELEAQRKAQGLEAHVHLPGFRQYGDLPAFYAMAGAFVHASTTEQWGLVVNEAAASGLPLIVANRCGCAAELVEEGVNGFTFDPLDDGALAGLLGRIAECDQRAAMGAASRRIVAAWGPERFGAGLKAAAEYALAQGQRRLTVLDRLLIRGVGERQNRVRNHPSD